jgi:protein arginine kinase activator
LESFLGGMLTSTPEDRTAEKSEEGMTCTVCGYSYSQLQEKGMLGCSACYSSFRRQLIPMLRRYHGAVNHLGKLPRSHGPQAALRREIISMKQLLEQAVAQESYEEAARIRDEIREKEHQLESIQPDGESDHTNPANDSEEESER